MAQQYPMPAGSGWSRQVLFYNNMSIHNAVFSWYICESMISGWKNEMAMNSGKTGSRMDEDAWGSDDPRFACWKIDPNPSKYS